MTPPRRKTRRRKTEPAWYWVQGLTKLHGIKLWTPLYCSKTEEGAQKTIVLINGARNHSDAKASEKEMAATRRYREFRVVPDSEPDVRCSECTSNYLKRIKSGDERLWKCLNCGHSWAREAFTGLVHDTENASKAPTRLPKALSGGSRGVEPSRRTSGRQKKPQRPVQTPRKRRKIR